MWALPRITSCLCLWSTWAGPDTRRCPHLSPGQGPAASSESASQAVTLLGEASLSISDQAWSPCVNDICLYKALVHLTLGMAFYGSRLLSGSGKINTFSKTRCQLPGVATAANEWETGLPGAGATALGEPGSGCAKEHIPPTPRPQCRQSRFGVWFFHRLLSQICCVLTCLLAETDF